MAATTAPLEFDATRPIKMSSADFSTHKYDWYRWMLEEAPVMPAKISVMKLSVVSRYDDCRMVLTDDRFIRNRGKATGKGTSPLPFFVPKGIAAIARSMILEDDPEHRRLRNLVNKAFTPRAIASLNDRIESLSGDLLDGVAKKSTIDLLPEYALPIPSRVIAEMVGVSDDEMHEFQNSARILSTGLTGLSIAKTLVWDLRIASKFMRKLIEAKRQNPGDDILSALIHAEDDGDRLKDQELLAMVFLLILAGFETTTHLVSNSVRTLLEHPEQLERLRAQPELWDSAVEELVRFRGPVHGTKLQYATEDVEIHGVIIKKGSPVMPILGAANHDPRAFDKPEVFDISRTPNHHLGFGFGNHFCLGRQLALMETKVALKNLFDRYPNVRLAVPPDELKIMAMPGWHRHVSMPVLLN